MKITNKRKSGSVDYITEKLSKTIMKKSSGTEMQQSIEDFLLVERKRSKNRSLRLNPTPNLGNRPRRKNQEDTSGQTTDSDTSLCTDEDNKHLLNSDQAFSLNTQTEKNEHILPLGNNRFLPLQLTETMNCTPINREEDIIEAIRKKNENSRKQSRSSTARTNSKKVGDSPNGHKPPAPNKTATQTASASQASAANIAAAEAGPYQAPGLTTGVAGSAPTRHVPIIEPAKPPGKPVRPPPITIISQDPKDTLQHPGASEDKATCAGITSYEIPPAPKPFHGRFYQQQQSQQGARYTPTLGRSVGFPGSSVGNSELDLRAVKSSHSTADDKEYYIAFPPSGLPVHSFKANGTSTGKELKTPGTPIDSRDFPASSSDYDKANNAESQEQQHSSGKFNVQNNYANVMPILAPPPGMCIPFEYVNVTAPWDSSSSENKTTKLADNILTIQPEIHPEPIDSTAKLRETGNSEVSANENENENGSSDEPMTPELPESPKILNTDDRETKGDVPDYTNVQVAASEEIAKNFGVTLKKLPAPPVPPRCEFNFATTAAGVATSCPDD